MDFEKLKSSYILSMQSGLLAGVGYEDIKHELDMIEKTLEKEIDSKLGVSM